ncbi:undecaprenol kinase [Hydrogenobacter thermophilus TK-6]|uniref:Undecaprenyl-diphosphatase n=1 Tax=Hydrogenobacter thermophilus (strain DSM 6534 / IAM 12695 / TK-6) TaxID=608538 RepID=D3DFC7_HYDTT|nr:undecaprenyl-diphosphate phosphatase [Hydrogenobacter thermophilus]ADO44473.1 undecaprenol kinase [Hydrogenobacter thermophilus TK-6]BAI68529.1 undecaprenyl-diphosphatase [Hydrogenobacter thermophilus TK-6]
MNIHQAIILGIVEGLTEFLPVSSTGHLILTAHLMGLENDNFTKSFEISIQMGAILAVLFLYTKRFLRDYQVWKRILVAFFPTGLLGFLLYKFIKNYLVGNDKVVVASLFLGGVFLLFADRVCERFCYMEDASKLSLRKAFMIGIFQSLAMIPGVSRSASTIIGGMLMGLNRKASAEFSFLLAVPTMLIATSYDVYKSHTTFTNAQWYLLFVGFLSAFLTALITVKVFIGFISRHSFLPFGIYRILISFAYGFYFL